MTELLNAILQRVGVLYVWASQILSIVDSFQKGIRVGGVPLGSPGWAEEWNTTYNVTNASAQLLADGTTGLVAAHVEREAILAAIAAITPTPAVPPPSADTIASAVWLSNDPNASPSRVYGDEIWEPYRLAKESAVFGMHRSGNAPGFAYFDSDQPSDLVRLNVWPTPDWSDIRVDDTRLTWLVRTDTSGLTWSQGPTEGYPTGFDNTPPFPVPTWFPLFSAAEFDEMKVTAIGAAPVWPGLEAVVLGTPVALGSDVTVPGPLDGLLVAVTTAPVGGGRFVVGGFTYYYRAGEVSFTTDNGQVEPWQYLTWDQGLYCPRFMSRAASALVRGLAGIEGTATPWLTV